MPFGYAGQILKLDLSANLTALVPTAYYSQEWIGGRGIGAKIYWDEVSPGISSFDAENQLIFTTGPLAGFPGLAGSRVNICGKSPNVKPEGFSYASLGGSWGVGLKRAGFDGIAIRGKSETPVYVFLKDGRIEIKNASHLWGKSPQETSQILKNEHGNSIKTLAIGLAGENLVKYATVVADDGSSASSGFGAVLGAKKLKAIVVSGNNGFAAAQPELLRESQDYIRRITQDRTITPPNFVLPLKRNACYGCISGCLRTETGEGMKSMCQASGFYAGPAMGYYKKPTETPAAAYRLCNTYGLDTMVLEPIIVWLSRCQQEGVLTDENTNLPLSKYGSLEFIESLVKNISLLTGFGYVLAQGITRAAEILGKGTQELIGDLIFPPTEEIYVYDPRMYVTTGLFYATEPKRPITQLHEIAMPMLHWHAWLQGLENAYFSTDTLNKVAREFWGSEAAADFSTYEGKALAAKIIQDRQCAYECLTLCNYSWPIAHVRHSDHMGDSLIESQILSAITGKSIEKDKLYQIGERVFNCQRAILVREGWLNQRSDNLPEFNYDLPLQFAAYKPECRFNPDFLLPGQGGKVISKKGAVIERARFSKMKEEYYSLRGWDANTISQTI